MKKLTGIFLLIGLFVFLVPTALASADVYSVEKLYFSDLSGTVLENPAQSCMVNVEVKKQKERTGNDDVIISSYATDGSLIGFTVVSGTINTGETSIFRTFVDFPADKTLGTVKAYVWNSFTGMQALSNTLTVEVNQMSGEITPTPEKYIPDEITVYGKIVASARSDYFDPGEYIIEDVYIPVDYSTAYTQEEYSAINERYRAISNFYGIPLTLSQSQSYYNRFRVKSEINLDSYLFCEGEFTVKKDADDRIVILSFEPKSSNFVNVNAEDYIPVADGGKSVSADGKITFGSKNYKVNGSDGEIYVNGKYYKPITDANLAAVLGLAQGEVKLIDDDSSVEGYDKIMVTVYGIAKVSAVTYANGVTTIQITTKSGLNYINSIKISDEAIEDGEVDLSVVNNEGEKVNLSSIKKGDIIAFATEINSMTTLTDPAFIDIIVTDKTVSGIVTREESSEETYTIADEDYKTVVWGDPALIIGNEYIISLDPFGRIYEGEVIATSEKYAIAEKYDSDYGVRLVLPDGTVKWYELDTPYVSDWVGISTTGTLTLSAFEKYIELTKASHPEERVVQYTVKSSTGKITSIKLIGKAATTMTYKAAIGKLGSKAITDRTAIIDASKYGGNISGYAPFAVSSFVDGADYDASVFVVSGSANRATFVVLTGIHLPEPEEPIEEPDESDYTINRTSRFAVVRKPAAQAVTDDGDLCYSVNVLYEGEEQDLWFTTTSGATVLKAGDAIFFIKDEEGLVKTFIRALSVTRHGYTSNPTFTGEFRSFGGTGVITNAFTFDPYMWDYTIKNTAKKDYQIVYGIVTDVRGVGIELADAIDSDGNGTFETIDLNSGNYSEVFDIDADCVTYRYDVNEQTAAANQYKAINIGGATASTIAAYEVSSIGSFTPASGTEIYNLKVWDGNGESHLTYALALIIDGKIVEIYTIAQ